MLTMIGQSKLGGLGGLPSIIFALYGAICGFLVCLQLFAVNLKSEYCTSVPIGFATHGRDDLAAKSIFEEGCIV